MPRGISLHVGINEYSSAFPGAGKLEGCRNDAVAMEKIAKDSGFEQRDLLLGCDATYMRVTAKILSAASQLEKDDIFFFSFAGHGYQHGDKIFGGDERDGLDETLLLFDAELFDDVLRKELWPRFKPGVRILMVADSCHSETANFVPPTDNEDGNSPPPDMPVTPGGSGAIRSVKPGAGDRHLEEYGEFYRSIKLPSDTTISASIMLLAACLDMQTTGDGNPNGVYTDAMLKVLESKPVDYFALREGIQKIFDDADRDQTPTISMEGPDFRGQKPFMI